MAAAAVLAVLSVAPPSQALERSWNDGSVPGILHIHTNQSDGRSGADEIAAAASRAGLKFLVFTDHGDATRVPDPPTYRSGVLCLTGVEISTTGGHYVVLDMGPSPYPLAGEARDVVEDVRRLGGFGIAAHPDSPKAELAWRDWNAPIDGIELVNPDTSWRVHLYEGGWQSKLSLLRALAGYPFRTSEAIGSLLVDSRIASQWTAIAERRRIVGIAGVDAHASLALTSADPGTNQYALPIPGYEPSFRTLSVHVTPESPLTGEPEDDATRIVRAIRKGRLYVAVDAWASPPAFELTATNRNGKATMGDELAPGGPLLLQVLSNAPSPFVTRIWKGNEIIADEPSRQEVMLQPGEEPSIYRVEIRDPRHPDRPAWVISNPIYVRPPAERVAPPPAPATPTLASSLFDGRSAAGWTTESDATSIVALDVAQTVAGSALRVRYGLSGGASVGQYAGVAVDTIGGVARFDRVSFRIRGEGPMRISVQARAEIPNAPPERWQRSIFIDTTARERSVFFADMAAVGQTRTPRPPLHSVRNLMFIIDTTNTKPGASGRIWLNDVRLEK